MPILFALMAALMLLIVMAFLAHETKPKLRAIDPMLDLDTWYQGIFEVERVSKERRKYYEEQKRLHDLCHAGTEGARPGYSVVTPECEA